MIEISIRPLATVPATSPNRGRISKTMRVVSSESLRCGYGSCHWSRISADAAASDSSHHIVIGCSGNDSGI